MKTEKFSGTLVNLKIFMVLPVIVVVLIALSSCGKSKSTEAALAPPPVAQAPDPVFNEVDEMPVFQNGITGLLEYVKGNTKYPDEAKLNNIMGNVLVKFVVEKDCTVSNVELEKGVNPLLDAEALRVVNTLPKFEKPGKKAGEPVRVQFMIPITFKLK